MTKLFNKVALLFTVPCFFVINSYDSETPKICACLITHVSLLI